MEKHAEDARRKAMVIDIDMLVPKDHLLRKIEGHGLRLAV